MARSAHPASDAPRASCAGPLALRVPASTSNLGPGFDLLGLALSLYLEVEVCPAEGSAHEWDELGGEAASWPRDDDNLLVRAYVRGCEAAGVEPRALQWRARSEIPIGRGLGSSGAAVAAGLIIARELAGREACSTETLLAIGCELEGHPDNSTASLLGGCTLAVPHAKGLSVIEQPFHPSIGLAVAWPASQVSTQTARAALPASVPHIDAVENPRRLALLLEGLRTGDPNLLTLAEEERLHVRFRLPLIPSGGEALTAAREAGAWLATISGSGSSLVALGPKGAMQPVAKAMTRVLDAAAGPAQGRVVEPVRVPPAAIRGTLADL